MMAATADCQHFLSVGPRWALGQVETQTKLNERLAAIVPKQGHRLFATTLTENSIVTGTREAKNAENLSVGLIPATRSLGCVEKSSDAWLNITPHCFYRSLQSVTEGVDVILAHAPDYVWGALNIQDAFFPGSHLVLFNHSFPENISKVDKKNIGEWAARATLVISFDEETYNKYNALYTNLVQTIGRVDHRHIEIGDLTMELLRNTPASLSVAYKERTPDLSVIGSNVKAAVDVVDGKASPETPVVSKISPKAKQVNATSPLPTLAANFSSMAIPSPSPKTLDWHDQITPTLRKFHDEHARLPEKAIKAAMPFFEGTMKLVEGKLKEKNLCVRFEYTGSAFEKVMIDADDIEFDLMVIMSKGNDIDSEPFDDETGGYFLLKPKEDYAKGYAKMIHSPEQPVLSPEKLVKVFFGALQKALNEMGITGKSKLRKHGPAVQMDVYHDVDKTQKYLSIDIVPALQIRLPGEVQLFVAKPYKDAKVMNLSWRRSFSVEEKLKFKEIDKGDGCRRMCVRILKAIRKPPQSIKRKADSSFAHITSFMIKNTLFHENDIPSLNWGMDKLGPRTIGLISRLSGYLESGCFPHYYLPQINIVAGLEAGPRVNLANRLQHLVSSDIEFRKVIGGE